MSLRSGRRRDDAPAVAVPTWASLASGATSGLASCVLLQPMDLLKTRMQQQQSETATMGREGGGGGGPKRRTQRLIRLTRTVVEQDGWRGLWRGTVPTVARNVPGVAMYFYSVSEVRSLLSRSQIPILALPNEPGNDSKDGRASGSTLARLSVAGNLASGAVARVAVGFLLSPITIVKARFESSHFSKDAYPSLTKALAEVYRSGGVRGLFRGFSATALRDAPYAGLYLAIYEKAKDGMADVLQSSGKGDARELRGSSLVVSTSGLFAGTLATLLTHPFDILKTRMQTMPQDAAILVQHHRQAATAAAAVPTTSSPTLIGMMRHIAQTDGLGAYLDGLGLRCARKAASSAIGWTIFEGGRGLWVRRHQNYQQTRDLVDSAQPTIVSTST